MGNRVVLNGKSYDLPDGSVSIINKKIYINGKEWNAEGEVNLKNFDTVNIEIHGDVNEIKTNGSVIVHGHVKVDIDAGGSVRCGDVGGDVDASGSVHCGDVRGRVDAGGSVHRK